MLSHKFVQAILIGAALVLPASLHAEQVTPEEARAIAKEAYIYGYPMVSNYRILNAYSIDTTNPEYKGPFNQLINTARVYTPADQAVVTPNSDTPYSTIAMDLRAEPLVLTLPPIDKDRYYSVQLVDLFTFNFDYLGTRATGNDGGKFLVAGPGWKGETPKGIDKVVRSECQFGLGIYRTQLFNPGDLDNVKKIQAGYEAQPLSAFLGEAAPAAAAAIDWPKPLKAEDTKDPLEFLGQLGFLLQFCPTVPSEVDLRERFAKIGIEPGKPFDAASLSPEMQKALKDGMQDGQDAIGAARDKLTSSADDFGTREFLKNDYLARAVGAQVGIYGNSKEEALYGILQADADGKGLTGGAERRYTLRYAPGELPPAKAFWSLTMYGIPDQLLVENPINRYLINSPMLPNLKRDADGGFTLYIQHDSPGAEHEVNWLPAPNGPFMMVQRIYLPEPAALDGQWKQPPVQRAN
jgi:hypothetical protein